MVRSSYLIIPSCRPLIKTEWAGELFIFFIKITSLLKFQTFMLRSPIKFRP